MARILALDYGQKRTGIAVSDPMRIIATPLTTVETKLLVPFLNDYFQKEEVKLVLLGYPLALDGSATDNTERVEKFATRFKRIFPHIELKLVDEAFTSKMAQESMLQSGMKKSERRKKENIDMVSAAILLQDYLGAH